MQLTNCVVKGGVIRKETASYLLLNMKNCPEKECIIQKDDTLKVSNSPWDPKRVTLLIKLPRRGRRFLCTFTDHEQYPLTSYDMKDGLGVNVTVKFGRVWPDASGYTWMCENVTVLDRNSI